jgi:hypothetical protein
MNRLAWLALAALAVLPYAATLRSPLLYDDRTLLDNRWLAHDAGPASVFEHDYWYGTRHAGSDLYRPATVLSLAWNLRLLPSKEGIRAVNVVLHVIAVLAVFGMLARITDRSAAWIGAALFAVHPLASEAVLWAVGRAEIAAAIFGIVAFVALVGASRVPGTPWPRLAIASMAFFAALAFKESAVSWLAIGIAWIATRSPEDRPGGRRLLAPAVALALPLLAYLALRGAAVGWAHHAPPLADNPLVAVSATTRVANAVLLFVRYAGKMVWPATLSIEYGLDQIPIVPALPWGAIAAAAASGAVVAILLALRTAGRTAAAFLAALVPCSFAVTANALFPIGTIFAERLAYTGLIGFCGLAGLLLSRIGDKRWRAAAVALLLVAAASRTIARGRDYRDLETLTEATVEASPRAVKALANSGRTRLRAGDAAGARERLERAVTIWPEYTSAWRLLAEACAAAGDGACAERARASADAAAGRTQGADEPL